jgi:hypothetical protein
LTAVFKGINRNCLGVARAPAAGAFCRVTPNGQLPLEEPLNANYPGPGGRSSCGLDSVVQPTSGSDDRYPAAWVLPLGFLEWQDSMSIAAYCDI